MLVLTRRAGESIMIDGRIELKVLRIKGSQVHIGIEAPRETGIHRKEVWLRLEGEQSPEDNETADAICSDGTGGEEGEEGEEGDIESPHRDEDQTGMPASDLAASTGR